MADVPRMDNRRKDGKRQVLVGPWNSWNPYTRLLSTAVYGDSGKAPSSLTPVEQTCPTPSKAYGRCFPDTRQAPECAQLPQLGTAQMPTQRGISDGILPSNEEEHPVAAWNGTHECRNILLNEGRPRYDSIHRKFGTTCVAQSNHPGRECWVVGSRQGQELDVGTGVLAILC